MSPVQGSRKADALVIFGVTGDLARKQIFPALYTLAKRDALQVPVVGVAGSKITLAEIRARAEQAVRDDGKVDDPAALRHMLSQLRYVSGDYADRATFTALKTALGAAKRPVHYLAIPPALFPTVIERLGVAGLGQDARANLAKTFGGAPASARRVEPIPGTLFSHG